MMWYDRPLVMSIPDIVKEYREAAFPVKQIDILADLNDTKPSRIAWILKRCGCDVAAKKMPRVSSKSDTIDYVALWEQSDDARICDEYKTLKENEIMSEVQNASVAAVQQENEIEAVQPDISAVKPSSRPAGAVYTDVVGIYWNTYMNVRYGVVLDHEDIMHLIALSDVARAAAGGAV